MWEYFCQQDRTFWEGAVRPWEIGQEGDQCILQSLQPSWKSELFILAFNCFLKHKKPTLGMCNLGNLWSLSLDFSNRVWHGQLSCPRSFLWRLLWVLLLVGETWRNRQTWVSIFWERKSKVDNGLLTRVLAFVLLSSQNLEKLLGCLDIISHKLSHVTAH